MDLKEIKLSDLDAGAACCGDSCEAPGGQQDVKAVVRERYAQIAVERDSCCGPSPAGAMSGHSASLYSAEELQSLPEGVAELSLGCGNPTAIAELRPGEVVLDLGSGGGIDCFLSAYKVGPQGRVIGLDMTPEMIERARLNAKKLDLPNVEFHLGEMEAMPFPDATADVIISNCVINLSPDKDAVLAEAFRVLRPGGRLCVSDIVKLGTLPEEVQRNLEMWAGCVAGSLERDEYQSKLASAGFTDISMASKEGSSLGGKTLPIDSFYITARKSA